jgi:hypothetical protein
MKQKTRENFILYHFTKWKRWQNLVLYHFAKQKTCKILFCILTQNRKHARERGNKNLFFQKMFRQKRNNAKHVSVVQNFARF